VSSTRLRDIKSSGEHQLQHIIPPFSANAAAAAAAAAGKP